MTQISDIADVIVIGGGHAGCEASLACARLGLKTLMFTVSVDSIALMPCNPNIGGSSKGHLVREIDALGGEMGKNIDRTFIQSKMLNCSKGPAVHSLRAQADKSAYTLSMRSVMEHQQNLIIRQQEVSEILTYSDVSQNKELQQKIEDFLKLKKSENKLKYCKNDTIFAESTIQRPENVDNSLKVIGIKTVSGAIYLADAVILCTGVYLKSRCIYGDVSQYTGPNGLMAANHLSDSLEKNGISLVRFKTGTPARIDSRSIDFSKCVIQNGDTPVIPFSFSTDPSSVQIDQKPCWMTYTNEETHRVIRENIERSPLYGGVIHGTGPRYCPSIEDKVMKFPDKDRHQVFIEPEGNYTGEMYIDGMSSSMPEDVQVAMYRSVPGLEHAEITRFAYAIEYDCLAPKQLKTTLEFKKIHGLFSGGQFNGSSGYEEAAAQGLIAGINAAMYCKGKEPLVLLRSESYIGVLIDDLVTKENFEPYRMMTSRAEYRLLLRQDNADLRLRKYGYRVGLVSADEMQSTEEKREQIRQEIERISHQNVGTNEQVQQLLASLNSTPLSSGATIAELIRRPELSYQMLAPIDPDRPAYNDSVGEQVNIEIKYEGYIRRQKRQVEQFEKTEGRHIPDEIDYDLVPSLRIEARQKLKEFRPANLGQAGRIAGVSPADLSVLLVWLKQQEKK